MDFSRENGLTCLYTKFQKIKGKLWTITHPNNAKAQIDYIPLNGARGVMVIVKEYGHGDPSSIPGQDSLHFTLH